MALRVLFSVYDKRDLLLQTAHQKPVSDPFDHFSVPPVLFSEQSISRQRSDKRDSNEPLHPGAEHGILSTREHIENGGAV
jgi:hypothetical protein